MFTLGIFKQSLRRKPIAWRNLGFIKNNPKNIFSNEDLASAQGNVIKYCQTDHRYVPDKHRDFHAQVRTILDEVLSVQQLANGLEWCFTIDGQKQEKIFNLFFPVLFFMGDTVEHNKLCSLKAGPNAEYKCRICNCPKHLLDEPCRAITLGEKTS